jgi:hypothetical protein
LWTEQPNKTNALRTTKTFDINLRLSIGRVKKILLRVSTPTNKTNAMSWENEKSKKDFNTFMIKKIKWNKI